MMDKTEIQIRGCSAGCRGLAWGHLPLYFFALLPHPYPACLALGQWLAYRVA